MNLWRKLACWYWRGCGVPQSPWSRMGVTNDWPLTNRQSMGGMVDGVGVVAVTRVVLWTAVAFAGRVAASVWDFMSTRARSWLVIAVKHVTPLTHVPPPCVDCCTFCARFFRRNANMSLRRLAAWDRTCFDWCCAANHHRTSSLSSSGIAAHFVRSCCNAWPTLPCGTSHAC